ncbi:hypothetical protein [Bremerella sp.]|uniref:hypothetical protein n=1 Tax=Bremerella sp. TaxID=2795602 RepID=UPI00391ADB04
MSPFLSKFAVRAYLILFTFLLMPLGIWLLFVFPIVRQHMIADHLTSRGAEVEWETGGSPWVERYLGSYWCTEVVSVDLSRCENSKEMLPWLPRLRSLKHVDLSYCDLKDDDLLSLSRLRSLIFLEIEGNERLTDQGLICLEKLSNLQGLAYSAPIGKRGLDSLSKHSNFEMWNLTVEQVSLQDLLRFPALSKVNELHIKRPVGGDWPEVVRACGYFVSFQLTDASVDRQQLQTILQADRIGRLDLTNVRLEESALPMLAEDTSRLQGVCLTDTDVTYEQMFARLGPNASSIVVSNGGKSLQMNFSGWRYVHWEGKRPIAKLSKLSLCENCTFLRVYGALLPNWDLSVLANMPALTGIGLHGPLTDENLLCISQVNQLSNIDLSGPLMVTPRGIAHLYTMSRLKSLELSHTELDEAHFQEIGKMNSLHELSLSHSSITNAGMIHLKSLQSLEMLTLNHCEYLDDAAMPHISQLNSLSHLKVNNVPISDEGLIHLHGMPNLNSVELHNTNGTFEGEMKLERMLSSADTFWFEF